MSALNFTKLELDTQCDVLHISVHSDEGEWKQEDQKFIYHYDLKKFYFIKNKKTCYEFVNHASFRRCLSKTINMWRKLNASCIDYDRILTIYFNDVIVFSYGDDEEEFTTEKRDQIIELFDNE